MHLIWFPVDSNCSFLPCNFTHLNNWHLTQDILCVSVSTILTNGQTTFLGWFRRFLLVSAILSFSFRPWASHSDRLMNVRLCVTGAAARRGLAPAERGEKSLLRVPERSAPSVQLPGNTSLRRPARLLAAPHAGQQLRRSVFFPPRVQVSQIEKIRACRPNGNRCVRSQSNTSRRWSGARSSSTWAWSRCPA